MDKHPVPLRSCRFVPSRGSRVAAVDIAEDDATFALAGATLTPDVSGALWWSAHRTLVVSDLHLEKGSSYAARGIALPPYDTRATLLRLARLIARLRPAQVISLGDSFHDAETDARMDREDRAALGRLVASVERWVWILGNHDPAVPDRLGGTVRHELTIDDLVFRHEPTGAAGEAAGHLHPCARVSGRGGMLRRRCFATDGVRLVLPAFGAFAGGLSVCDPAFAAIFPDAPSTVHVLGRERVWPIRFDRVIPD
jgi:DNA ligase-associated metallophosphoesterase